MGPAIADERRSSPRVPFFGQAVIRAAGRHVPCTTVNLSATGMLLLPAASARAGLTLRVLFQVEHFLGQVELAAVLAREGDYQGTYGWGIRFLNVPARVGSLLQLFVQQRMQADRDQATTPPLGVDNGDPNEHGQYLQVKRRPTARGLTALAPGKTGPEQPAAALIVTQVGHPPAPESTRASSGSYRQVGSVVHDTLPGAQGSAARPAVLLRASQEPSLEGMSAATGQGVAPPSRTGTPAASQRAIGHYAHAGARRISADKLDQTGPPRRGAESAMHQTGPRQRVQAKGRKSSSNAGRRSAPTPVEVRELYQAALEELDGKRGKKKRGTDPHGGGSKGA